MNGMRNAVAGTMPVAGVGVERIRLVSIAVAGKCCWLAGSMFLPNTMTETWTSPWGRNGRGKGFYCFLTALIELRKEIWGSKNSLTPPKVQSAISSLPLPIKLFEFPTKILSPPFRHPRLTCSFTRRPFWHIGGYKRNFSYEVWPFVHT